LNTGGIIRIAVDAMGGDHAPHVVVEGAIDALQHTGNRFEIILVGDSGDISAELQKYPSSTQSIRIEHAPETVNFNDDALAPLRTKKQSSIAIGLQLHKSGEADAFVSAGHTGAVMSASTLILGRIEGVGRPTIAATLPSVKGYCLLTDAGTNVDCRPQHLREFGIMASIFAEEILHYKNPRVGLLSFGEENNKGNELTLEAFRLLEASGLNFVGNIEGRDILNGKVQVAVCDGFTGNVILKFAEGVIELLKTKLKMFADKSLWNRLHVILAYGTLKKVLKEFDYQEYGGVPLLGINGVTIIGHGKSSAKAIKNMILKAEEMVTKQVNVKIQQTLTSER
jgi:phosphate acyltransferase